MSLPHTLLNLCQCALLSLPQAPGGHELVADYWEMVGAAPAGGVENVVTEHSHIDQQLDNRHLMLRGETVSNPAINSRMFIHFYSAAFKNIPSSLHHNTMVGV